MWKEILKAPYPNRVLGNRKARGGRRIKEGSGKYGLFRYDEIDEILNRPQVGNSIRSEIDEAYEKEIEKVTKKNIRESKKKLGDKYSSDMDNYIKRRVRNTLTEQKKTNLYATTYGEKNWFAGFRKLGYDPNDDEALQRLMARIKGVGNRRFVEWEEKRQEERKERNAEFLKTVSFSGWENYPGLTEEYNKGPLSEERNPESSAKAESAKILTANVEGKTIAHIVVLEISDGTIWLHEIKVDNKYRRRGIANLLMKELIKSYGDKTITGLIIASGKMSTGNLVLFYRKHGFKTRMVLQTDGLPGIEIKRG